MLALLLASTLSVAGLPVGQAEVLCDLAFEAQKKGETDFWPRAWDYLGQGRPVAVEAKIELQAFCLGRSVEKTRALEAKAAARR
jgi:hypothetical protein